MSEFKEPTRDGDADATRATAHLPGLDIEIVHRRAADGGSERMSIHLQAAPSFDAFGRYLEAANPFALWTQAVQLAWSPWLAVARAMMPPGAAALFLPDVDTDPRADSGSRESR